MNESSVINNGIPMTNQKAIYVMENWSVYPSQDLNEAERLAKIALDRMDVVQYFAERWAQDNNIAIACIGREILLMLDGSIKIPEIKE